MAKTEDTQLCQQYLVNYLESTKKQFQQCQLELQKQSESFSLTTLSLIQIDQCLKGYVDCQRKYLRTRNQHQFSKFKDSRNGNDSFKPPMLGLATDHHVRVTDFLSYRLFFSFSLDL